MNRIVFRYADVLLERAEAYAQLNETGEGSFSIPGIFEYGIKFIASQT